MSDRHEPAVSVVVSTRQRAASLPALLHSLEHQTLIKERFEVVITDDASTDETPRVLEDLAAETVLPVRVVRLERNGGPAVGRNAAWRVARGRVIAFTDDDCQPSPTWLERGLAAMEDGADVVAGRTHPNPDQLDRLGPYSRTMWPEYAYTFPTCNMFYRRADLDAVGGFDEGFGFPGGEDSELAWRIRDLGRSARVVDDVVVYHDVHRGSFRAAARDTLRWDGIPLLYRRRAHLRDQLYARVFWKQHHLVLLAVVGLALAPLTVVSIGLAAPWVLAHLRKRREMPRLVDRIVTMPGAFLIDLLTIGVLAWGSIRHRSLVL